jgi:hypothetical protein
MQRHTNGAERGSDVSFIVGLILFVVVIGYLDAGLPWPRPWKREG